MITGTRAEHGFVHSSFCGVLIDFLLNGIHLKKKERYTAGAQ